MASTTRRDHRYLRAQAGPIPAISITTPPAGDRAYRLTCRLCPGTPDVVSRLKEEVLARWRDHEHSDGHVDAVLSVLAATQTTRP